MRADVALEKRVDRLTAALREAAYHVSEMGCTCSTERRAKGPGHGRDCVGERLARDLMKKGGGS